MIEYYINNKMCIFRPNSDILPRVGDSVHLIWTVGTTKHDKMVKVDQILYIIEDAGNDHPIQIKVFCE